MMNVLEFVVKINLLYDILILFVVVIDWFVLFILIIGSFVINLILCFLYYLYGFIIVFLIVILFCKIFESMMWL